MTIECSYCGGASAAAAASVFYAKMYGNWNRMMTTNGNDDEYELHHSSSALPRATGNREC